MLIYCEEWKNYLRYFPQTLAREKATKKERTFPKWIKIYPCMTCVKAKSCGLIKEVHAEAEFS